MDFLANFLKYILFLTCISYSMNAVASDADNRSRANVVNILTWWGYLNYPEIIKGAEKECHTTISFDEYYSNDEFLRRWKGQEWNYDIIIFSNTIYNLVKKDIRVIKESNLWQQAYHYHPVIKNKYFKTKYPPNVVFFLHSLTGFLYNPANITLTEQDTIYDIFNKAKNNIVVIMDDADEVNKLLSSRVEANNKNKIFLIDFKKIYQKAQIYVGNAFKRIYEEPEFSFSFIWSGAAVKRLKENREKYKFLIHPKLSYISSDLLAQINRTSSVSCVAKYLTSKKAMTIIQNKDYYFSSYARPTGVKDEQFLQMYKKFLMSLKTFKWLESSSQNNFYYINHSWELIKFSLIEERMGELKKGKNK